MKLTESIRNLLLIAALALIGAAATLPLAMDALRGGHAPAKPERIGTVKLTCFDREMRASSCEVATPTTLASSAE
jgi:hypothetical protein